jgi:hypothetical protein
MPTTLTKDGIDYDPNFTENVQGQLIARFRTDSDGVPLFEEDEDGTKHYVIDISLRSPKKSSIDKVVYLMEDPSFADDPKAVSKNRAMDFKQGVSSYGDVPVLVSVEMDGEVYEQRAWLSNMLTNGYAGQPEPAVQSAIKRLKIN